MFRNYLVTALRNIARHKLYSAINIGGLAVGLTCAILIALYVHNELSFDKWLPGSDRLYRVEVTFHIPGQPDIVRAQITMPMVAALREKIPEVKAGTRLVLEQMSINDGNRQFLQNVSVVDPNFLSVIQLPFVEGDPRTALSQPESAVLSQTLAHKLFGESNPIGKTISTVKAPCAADAAVCENTAIPLKVTGILRDLPPNSQFRADILVPNTSVADRHGPADKQLWLYTYNSFGYVALAPGADPAAVLAKLKAIMDREIDTSSFGNVPGSRILEPRLVPLLDAHLLTDQFEGMRPAGSWAIVIGIALIGIIIMLVACMNFMNLATAQATLRAREISLRKFAGARRSQLMVQFLGEAVLVSLLALILGFALAEISLSSFNEIVDRSLTFHYLANWPLTASIIGIALLAGLISGFYPALVLSGFRPIAFLRINAVSHSGSGRVRGLLVLLQFAASIGLAIVALVVYLQIDLARHVDLGMRRDGIIIVSTGGRLTTDGIDSFVAALRRGPGIVGVARSHVTAFSGSNSIIPVNRPDGARTASPTHVFVSPDYFQLYGIKLIAGRVLSDKRADDIYWHFLDKRSPQSEGHNLMVSAALAKALGYSPDQIVGESFIFGKVHMRVVGVVADTLANGVRSPPVQTVYVYNPSQSRQISVRVQPERMQEAISYIRQVSHDFVPTTLLGTSLLSDAYDGLYSIDEKQDRVLVLFFAIAIFIACLGLFGLAAFTAGQRTREIGIRKVFGARVFQIVWLLLTKFSTPVLLANLIAWPMAWFYLNHWLQGFAYRITLNPLYFVGVGLAALLIAWATVFGHAVRVANAKPIHALHHE